ncbi:hypothetical protein CW304_20920 [Bacillus sp. UFRGS-B20]|nr:hypothetical protein CW304_20920 [Bacillus sp. UFRGS-B20]
MTNCYVVFFVVTLIFNLCNPYNLNDTTICKIIYACDPFLQRISLNPINYLVHLCFLVFSATSVRIFLF